LSTLRQARGISLEELARSAGISPHYLAMIEKGERVAEGPIARALAQTLGVAGWEGGN
jgi:transcriptional regulator with XRE-family HTH domain